MRTFAGIDKKYTTFEKAKILLQSLPYDGTSTWGKGADKGFEAFLNAAENMELYDIETDSEVYRKGIYMPEPITENKSPEAMVDTVYDAAKTAINSGKFPTFFGGEHSVSIGIIKAFYEKYPEISILQLDAHADLRESYSGTPFNHACALHDANKNTKLVQVGIRSMDISEKKYLKKNNCFFAQDIFGKKDWIDQVRVRLGEKVYITVDLDVFDPSIMPSTGTPEPGGLQWYPVLALLKKIFETKQVLGFDIVELAPREDRPDANFLAAKLYYKMLSYKFKQGKYNE